MLQRIKILKAFKKYLEGKYSFLYVYFALQFMIKLLMLVSPYMYINLIDKIMVENQIYFLNYIIGILLGTFLLTSILKYVCMKVRNVLCLHVETKLQKDMLQKYLGVSYKKIQQCEIGDLKKRITDDIASVSTFIQNSVVGYFVLLFEGILTIFILLKLSPLLLAISFIFIPISFLVTRKLVLLAEQQVKEQRKLQGKYERKLYNFLGNWELVKFYGIFDNVVKKIQKEDWKKLKKVILKQQKIAFANRAFMAFKNFIILEMGMYFLGGILIFNNKLDVVVLIAFMSFFAIFLQCISDVSENVFEYQQNISLMNNVLEIISWEQQEKEKIKDFQNLQMEDVSIELSGNEILKGINLCINKGERISIIGKNGSGKSTLLKVIMNIEDKSSGMIKINGIPIDEINEKSLYKVIRYLPQTPRFLNQSIRENLMLSNEFLKEKDLIAVCKKVGLWEEILKFPNGIDTPIGDAAMKISGGQKQRLAIARVLLTNPEVLILDEITASMDAENSQFIQYFIQNNLKDKTIIQITHKYNEIMENSRIIELRNKKIIEEF